MVRAPPAPGDHFPQYRRVPMRSTNPNINPSSGLADLASTMRLSRKGGSVPRLGRAGSIIGHDGGSGSGNHRHPLTQGPHSTDNSVPDVPNRVCCGSSGSRDSSDKALSLAGLRRDLLPGLNGVGLRPSQTNADRRSRLRPVSVASPAGVLEPPAQGMRIHEVRP